MRSPVLMAGLWGDVVQASATLAQYCPSVGPSPHCRSRLAQHAGPSIRSVRTRAALHRILLAQNRACYRLGRDHRLFLDLSGSRSG